MKLRTTAMLLPAMALLVAACSGARDDDPLPEVEPADGIDGDGDGAEDSVQPTSEEEADAPDPTDDVGGDVEGADVASDELSEDLEPIVGAEQSTELADGTPQVVYVNFGGPIVRGCSSFCNDATTNHSSLVNTYFKRSSVDFASYRSTLGRSNIISKLKTWFHAYNVVITTRRPSSGKYMMVVISPSAVGPSTKRGTSFLDCKNSTRKDIAFVYRISGVSSSTIARYAAHEIGHTLGLMHVTSTIDHMQYRSSGTRWTRATLDVARNPPGYSCIPGHSVQDAPALLRQNVGLRPE